MVTDDRLPELKDVFVKHGVVLAYLFGSQAEGRALPSSDVDIAALLTKGKVLYEDSRTHPRAGFTVRVVKQYIDAEHFRRLSLKYLNDSMAQYQRQRPAAALRERPND